MERHRFLENSMRKGQDVCQRACVILELRPQIQSEEWALFELMPLSFPEKTRGGAGLHRMGGLWSKARKKKRTAASRGNAQACCAIYPTPYPDACS